MYYCGYKRDWVEAFTPWKREPMLDPRSVYIESDSEDDLPKQQMFYHYKRNWYLDVATKTAALKVSRSVVSLESFSGEKEIFKCSGTIIENIDNYSIILTAASLLRCRNSVPDDIKIVAHLADGRSLDGKIEAYDFHYNVATIRIQADAPLPTAYLTRLNDCIPIDLSQPNVTVEKSFQLRPHSKSFDLIPGDSIIALGRFVIKPYDIMAAPGEFSIDRCGYDEFGCKELFMATCRITRCGIGGPLINLHGEIIGICFHDVSSTPFLPINIASIWWEQYKKHRQVRRPWLGMEVANLHAAPLEILERIIPKYPDALKGVIVEAVIPGSSAESAGIQHNDIITQFTGKRIQNFLELFENMWHNVGESVELEVIRASNDVIHLSMMVDEATSERLYSWPLWMDNDDEE